MKKIRRFFSKSQKDDLFIQSSGLCALCGCTLRKNWHADHVRPFSKGGETSVLNGQALCASCNSKKGKSIVSVNAVRATPVISKLQSGLREWQQKALFIALSKTDFSLFVATPGAGKTRFALSVGGTLLAQNEVARIVVVTPLTHLKYQWQKAAAKMGISLSVERESREPADHHGLIVTYAEVFRRARVHRSNAMHEKTMVILDEIHHAGDGNGWGDSLRFAFDLSGEAKPTRVLSLSGTPFRSDNREIPFVNYLDNRSQADYTLSYADALAAGYVRDVYFPAWEGELIWTSNARRAQIVADFATDLKNEQERAERLKTALLTGWSSQVIAEANQKLDELRGQGHERACGVIVCIDKAHADSIAESVREVTNTEPDVIHSDDSSQAQFLLKELSAGRRRTKWVVSVAMVSEGVDIPDLRVGVYLTNKTTEMFFRQFVGRIVRKIPDNEYDSDAYLYIPNDETILSLARDVQRERDHVIEEIEKQEKQRLESFERNASLFAPTSGLAIDAGTVIGDDVFSTEEIEDTRQFLKEIGVSAPIKQTAIALRRRRNIQASELAEEPVEIVTVYQRKELRTTCNRHMKRACARFDYEYKAVNRWLNKKTGVSTIGESTVDQLKKRSHLIDTIVMTGNWPGV